MKTRGIFAIIGAFIAPIMGALLRRDTINRKPMQRTHARGRKRANVAGKAGAKLWHRLSSGHSASAGWLGRKARKWARRGYGYTAPAKAAA